MERYPDMKQFHVISHTHWDREWYQPFEVFRHRLVDLIDHLLEIYREYPEYVFELDAQTVCLEDYLEVRPYRRAELERYIRSGNLKVGPWYVQNDFFLTGGEATVRNLLAGTALAEEFGACARCGYTPDQFGLIGQLPQVFRGFGIDNCVFGRGYRREGEAQPNEFEWRSPDGSAVLASFMSRWYNNAQRFPADPELALLFFREVEAAQESEAVTPHRLLMNGVDHLEAQENLLPVLEELNRRIAPDVIRQSTLCGYLEAVRTFAAEHGIALHRETGELRYGASGNVLQGTLSARLPLKRQNAHFEALIELRLEPLYILLEQLGGDALYDRDYFRYLWKSLLRNHPHDSICGCSTDRVHQDNANRFARIGDLVKDLTDRGVRQFWARLDRKGLNPAEYLLALFNPLPHSRSEVVTAEVFLPLDENPASIRLTGPAGEPVRFAVRSMERRFQTNYSAINLPGQIPALRVELEIAAEALPPCGFRVLRLGYGEGAPLEVADAAAGTVLENAFVRFTVDASGRTELLDKDSGEIFPDLVSFTDEGDAGHSYNFLPVEGGSIRELGAISRIHVVGFRRGLRQGVRVDYEFELPRDYDFELCRPTAETVPNRLAVEYILDEFSRHVTVETRIENRSGSHRLRAVFRPGIVSPVTLASVPFGFEQRTRDELLRQEGRHNADQPDSGVITIREGKRQFSCLNEGLHEYEHLADGRIALTLLRSTGNVNAVRYDEAGRWVRSGVEWCAPEGKLIGDHVFRFALRPGEAAPAELERELQAYLAPAFAAFDSVDPHKLTGGRPCDQCSAVRELFFRDLPPEKQRLPLQAAGIELNGDAVFSALKKAEDGNGDILRIYNPERRESEVSVQLPAGLRACPVRLDETSDGEPLCGNPLRLTLPAAAIRTLRLVREG